MLTSLVFLQQGNVKKSKNLMKIVNIEEDNSKRVEEIQWRFQERRDLW